MVRKLKALLQSNMCVKRTSCFAWLRERHIKNTSQHSSDFFPDGQNMVLLFSCCDTCRNCLLPPMILALDDCLSLMRDTSKKEAGCYTARIFIIIWSAN